MCTQTIPSITTKFGFILKMQEWFIIRNSIHINIYHHSVLKDKSYHHLIRHRRSLGQNPISLSHKNREEDKDGGNLPQSNDSIYDSIYKNPIANIILNGNKLKSSH